MCFLLSIFKTMAPHACSLVIFPNKINYLYTGLDLQLCFGGQPRLKQDFKKFLEKNYIWRLSRNMKWRSSWVLSVSWAWITNWLCQWKIGHVARGATCWIGEINSLISDCRTEYRILPEGVWHCKHGFKVKEWNWIIVNAVQKNELIILNR